MNPASASIPASPSQMADNSAPSVATAPLPAPAMPITANPTTSVAINIPVHTPQAQPVPVAEDHELDKIMHDVGQQMKKEPQKPKRHGFSLFHHEPKPLVKAPAQPARQPVPVPEPSMPVSSAASGAPAPLPQASAHPQVQTAAAPKPKTQRSMPIFVIFVTLCVTSFLVVAAIAAYRQS
ncbi:hypothetical protein KW794_01505 [Candidatus Saccharibacteria bacterium]|nr:hypothetical protein [Candidatus Saccharibacteria bacterium]